MITVSDYIKSILKKKKWTLQQFADEINKIKSKINISSITTPQNISNFLNEIDDGHILRPKQLVIWEKPLDLPNDILVNMVEQPKSKDGIKELNELKEKVRNGN